jgi:hypothetical protein
MKICYVDESGHCGEKFNEKQPVEVLCGVITDLYTLFKTQRQHSQIMDVLVDNGLPINELKAAEIYRGRREWKGVNLETRDKIYEALLKWSAGRKCSFVVCPIDCQRFFEAKTRGEFHATKLGFPWETGAFNVVMGVQRTFKEMKNNKGRTFMVFDEQQKHDQRFLKLFELEEELSFTDGFTAYRSSTAKGTPRRFYQIVDIPHFSKSHLSVLIQLADLAAYVVNRHLLLTAYGSQEDYAGEAAKIRVWYHEVGKALVTHTSIDAPGQSAIAAFYRSIRPKGWTAKQMKEESQVQQTH